MDQTDSESEIDYRLMFSNWIFWSIFSFIFSSIVLVALAILSSDGSNFNITSIDQYDKEVNNFSFVVYFSLIFLIVATTSLSIFLSMLPSYIIDLRPLFADDTKENRNSRKSGFNTWYCLFKKDMDYFKPRSIIAYVFLIGLLTIPHYLIWGNSVMSELGFNVWFVSTMIYWFMIAVTFKFIWVMFTEVFHLYRFTFIDDKILLGYSPPRDGMIHSFMNLAKNIELLPVNTYAWEYREIRDDSSTPNGDEKTEGIKNGTIGSPTIEIDLFNVDGLAGLTPLTNLTSLGTLMLAILFAIAVPLLLFGLDLILSIIILVISFLIIVGGYTFSISTVRDVIKTRKTGDLKKVNDKLAEITSKIINEKKISDGAGLGQTTEKLTHLMEQYHVYDEIGDTINDVPESPRSLSAILKILTSGSLPTISFGAIQQFGLFNLL